MPDKRSVVRYRKRDAVVRSWVMPVPSDAYLYRWCSHFFGDNRQFRCDWSPRREPLRLWEPALLPFRGRVNPDDVLEQYSRATR